MPRFLRNALFVVASFLIGGFLLTGYQSTGNFKVHAHVHELLQASIELDESYLSPVVESEKPFRSFLIALEREGSPAIDVRVRHLDGNWSSWEPVLFQIDGVEADDPRQFSSIIYTEESDAFQWKSGDLDSHDHHHHDHDHHHHHDHEEEEHHEEAEVESEPATIHYLDAITFSQEELREYSISNIARALSGGIVSRSGWGADDSLLYAETWSSERDTLCESKPWYCAPSSSSAIEARRAKAAEVKANFPYDTTLEKTITTHNGKELLWDVQVSDHISKVFVHHTAILNKDQNGDGRIDQSDEKIALRNIYYFHTVLRGWGDIGYNYVVGPTGTIYEGRFGGDKAVGAHAVWRNISSAGVAVMGNFQEESLSNSGKEGLVTILAHLTKKHGLPPNGNTSFYGSSTPAIVGHKDSDESATACPGDHIYVALPSIRVLAHHANLALSEDDIMIGSTVEDTTSHPLYKAALKGNTSHTLHAGEEHTFILEFKNEGAVTWDTSATLRLGGEILEVGSLRSGTTNPDAASTASTITPPSDTLRLPVTLQAGLNAGTWNIPLELIVGDKFIATTGSLALTIEGSTPSYTISNATFSEDTIPVGQAISGTLVMANSGTTPWLSTGDQSFAVDLIGTTNHKDYTTYSTLTLDRNIDPGGNVTLSFSFTAPKYPGTLFLSVVPRITNYDLLLGPPYKKELTITAPEKNTQLAISTLRNSLTYKAGSSGELPLLITNNSGESFSISDEFKFELSVEGGLEPTPITLSSITLAPGATRSLTGTVTFPEAYPEKERAISLLLYDLEVGSTSVNITVSPSSSSASSQQKSQEATLPLLEATFLPVTIKNHDSQAWLKEDTTISASSTGLYSEEWLSDYLIMQLTEDLPSKATTTLYLPVILRQDSIGSETFTIRHKNIKKAAVTVDIDSITQQDIQSSELQFGGMLSLTSWLSF